MWVRNRLYDAGVLTAVQFDLPTIAVGNLSLGGTGKTPHVEYLIRLLKEKYQVATLSRGYNRKTRGFLLADAQTTALEIGDEPMQFKMKFPDIVVSVGEERILAVPQLLAEKPDTEVILLDDAFQHRAIRPGLNILITDYHHLFTRDHVVPFGRLREGQSGYHRANCIIVSKCPPTLDAVQRRQVERELAPDPGQPLFFTSFEYGLPYHWLSRSALTWTVPMSILVVCAIADPSPMLAYLQLHAQHLSVLQYRDHYYFTKADILHIREQFEALPGQHKIVLTTEKDAVRLQLHAGAIQAVQLPLYVLPLEVRFLFDTAESFNNYIFGYVARLQQRLLAGE